MRLLISMYAFLVKSARVCVCFYASSGVQMGRSAQTGSVKSINRHLIITAELITDPEEILGGLGDQFQWNSMELRSRRSRSSHHHHTAHHSIFLQAAPQQPSRNIQKLDEKTLLGWCTHLGGPYCTVAVCHCRVPGSEYELNPQ